MIAGWAIAYVRTKEVESVLTAKEKSGLPLEERIPEVPGGSKFYIVLNNPPIKYIFSREGDLYSYEGTNHLNPIDW